LGGGEDPRRAPGAASARGKSGGKRSTDLPRIIDRDKLRESAPADPSLPAGLKSLVKDDEAWLIDRPTGHELSMLREWAQAARDRKESHWRKTLRTLRALTGSQA
jgi:hypothetical protein